MADRITVTVDDRALQRALGRFFAHKAPALAEAGAKQAAGDVVAETVRGITHDPPRRVSTGRYRSAWRSGAKAAGLSVSGLRGSVTGSATAFGSQEGDGFGYVKGSGLEATVTIGNAVEYAWMVEFGTAHMAPGHHLKRALETTRRAIPRDTGRGSIWRQVLDAWRKG